MSISLNTLKEAVQIKEQIAALEARLEKVLGGASITPAPVARGKRGRGKLSAAGRAKIAAAQKLRWAKVKGEAAPAKKAAKKKRVLSPEGRAKIVAALKKRWANAKK